MLSGYLITRLLLGEEAGSGRINLGRFYFRRGLRLYPALVCLCIVLGTVYLEGSARVRVARSLVATLGYVPNLYQTWSGVHLSDAFGHLWSLGVEEQFYLVWPLALLLLLRVPVRIRVLVLLGVATACVLFRWQLDQHGYNAYYLPTSWADALIFGSIAAMLPLPSRRVGLAAIVSAVVLSWLCLHGWSDRTLYAYGYTVLAVSNLVLVLAALNSAAWKAILSNPIAVWLGRRSYGFYLWHLPVIVATKDLFPRLDPWPTAAVTLPISLVITSASYRWIEQPFLRIKNRMAV